MRRVALGLLVLSVASCAPESIEFVCESDKQCDEDGEGLCARKWCSYPDEGCESGYRYTADAEESVAEQCVSPADLEPDPAGG